jgi:hypothetical protein
MRSVSLRQAFGQVKLEGSLTTILKSSVAENRILLVLPRSAGNSIDA